MKIITNFKSKYYTGDTGFIANAYINGNLAIVAVVPEPTEEGSYLFRPSVNLDGYAPDPKHDEFWFKTWAENEGLLEALLDVGFITEVGQKVTAGYGTAVLVKLTPEWKEELLS